MITALLGDVTRLDFDIVVIAVNEKYEPVNNIAKKIHENGRDELQTSLSFLGKGKLGQAKMTSVYFSPQKKIIHVVPPVYIDGNHQEAKILKAAYWNSMAQAFDYVQRTGKKRISLAFGSLSPEGHRYPSKEGCQIAVETIRSLFNSYSDAKKIDVTFVCDNREDYTNFKAEIRKV